MSAARTVAGPSTLVPRLKLTHPPILPIAPRTFGNNVPKSLHKTRRSWWPNVTRVDLPVPILSTSDLGAAGMLKGVKIGVKRIKDIEKAGGLEGLLTIETSYAFWSETTKRPIHSAARNQG